MNLAEVGEGGSDELEVTEDVDEEGEIGISEEEREDPGVAVGEGVSTLEASENFSDG